MKRLAFLDLPIAYLPVALCSLSIETNAFASVGDGVQVHSDALSEPKIEEVIVTPKPEDMLTSKNNKSVWLLEQSDWLTGNLDFLNPESNEDESSIVVPFRPGFDNEINDS